MKKYNFIETSNMELRFFGAFLLILTAQFSMGYLVASEAEILQFEDQGVFAKILPKNTVFPKEIDQHIVSFLSSSTKEKIRQVSTQAKEIIEEIPLSDLENLLKKSPVQNKVRAYLWKNKKIFFSPNLKKYEKETISNLVFENSPMLFFGSNEFHKNTQFEEYKKHLKEIHKIFVKAITQDHKNEQNTPQIFILEKEGKESILYVEIPIEFIIQQQSIDTLFPKDKTYNVYIRIFDHYRDRVLDEDDRVAVPKDLLNNFIENIINFNCVSKIQLYFEWVYFETNLLPKNACEKFDKITALFNKWPHEYKRYLGRAEEYEPCMQDFKGDIYDHSSHSCITFERKFYAYSIKECTDTLESIFLKWKKENLSNEQLQDRIKRSIDYFGHKNFYYFLKKNNIHTKNSRKRYFRKILGRWHPPYRTIKNIDDFINVFEQVLKTCEENTGDLFTAVRLYEHFIDNIDTEHSLCSKIKRHKIALLSALSITTALIGFLTRRAWLPHIKKLITQLNDRKTHSSKIM